MRVLRIKELSKELWDWRVIIPILLIAVGIFLRVYHLNDWLFLKGDQIRDAKMVSNAFFNGPGSLPLLGPRAGGTLLRLGPIFYYFLYLSSLIFQSANTVVFVYPNLLFSLLSIPLFYFFVKKYFNFNLAIFLTTLFSLSYLIIDYSRFAWNPNSTPFFALIFFYALLEIFESGHKHKYGWTIVAAISFSIATQLHFSVFVTFPVILSVLFLIKNFRKNISWKHILVFASIVLIFYIPVILSDIINNGDNFKQFFQSVDKKSSGSILNNAIKESYYYSKNFNFILAGYMGSERIIVAITQILIYAGLLLNVILFRNEKNPQKKNFLLLIILVFIVFYVVYLPLAPQLDNSRFFLPILMISFIYLGFVSSYIADLIKNKNQFFKATLFLILLIPLVYNITMDYLWFDTMSRSQNTLVTRDSSYILKAKGNKLWWSLSHFEKIAKFMKDDCEQKDVYFIVSKNVKDYSKSIQYIFNSNYPDINIHADFDMTNEKGCYYFVSQTADDLPKDMAAKFIMKESNNLGNINIIRFNQSFNSVPIENLNQDISNDLESDLEESVDSDVEPENIMVPIRVPRQFWSDVVNLF